MSLSEALTPHLNLRLERDGRVVLSVWRMQLLAAIEQDGLDPCSRCAHKCAFCPAWDRLDEIEHGLGLRLVERRAGGAGGGGAHLTAAGRDLADRFNVLAAAVDGCLAEHFLQSFGDL